MTTPPKKDFFQSIGEIQAELMWIGISMAVIVWFSGFDMVQNIFKPDFIKALAIFRMVLGFGSLGLLSITGQKLKQGLAEALKMKNDALKISSDENDKKNS